MENNQKCVLDYMPKTLTVRGTKFVHHVGDHPMTDFDADGYAPAECTGCGSPHVMEMFEPTVDVGNLELYNDAQYYCHDCGFTFVEPDPYHNALKMATRRMSK